MSGKIAVLDARHRTGSRHRHRLGVIRRLLDQRGGHRMQFRTLADCRWEPTDTPGSEKCELWRGGPVAYLVAYRVKKGVAFMPHSHPGWEQLTVISGRWQVDERLLGPGDVAITPPMHQHCERAIDDSVLLISVGNNDVAA
ncbi:MAG: hypothetical protein EXQ85_07950 [Alphaproteobacteria bacterium]|nr:hypothetical protein [Alphaproteobacteria bacterium]